MRVGHLILQYLMEPFASVAGVGSVCRSGGCTWGAGDMAGVFDRYGWSENVIDVGVDGAVDSVEDEGKQLMVPASEALGVKFAGWSIVVAV